MQAFNCPTGIIGVIREAVIGGPLGKPLGAESMLRSARLYRVDPIYIVALAVRPEAMAGVPITTIRKPAPP